jgi:hypothetical protein
MLLYRFPRPVTDTRSTGAKRQQASGVKLYWEHPLFLSEAAKQRNLAFSHNRGARERRVFRLTATPLFLVSSSVFSPVTLFLPCIYCILHCWHIASHGDSRHSEQRCLAISRQTSTKMPTMAMGAATMTGVIMADTRTSRTAGTAMGVMASTRERRVLGATSVSVDTLLSAIYQSCRAGRQEGGVM